MLRLLQRPSGPPSSIWNVTRFFSKVPRKIDTKNILSVALVGRPNTGKSTLFNRLTKTKAAIVSNIPGTTRDRREGVGYLAGLPMKVIDTGGFDDRGVVSADIQKQVELALASSHVILFMLDAREGVTSLDENFAKWIRQRFTKHIKQQQEDYVKAQELYPTSALPPVPPTIILLANKTEGAHLSDVVTSVVSDSFRLGFDEPVLVSASHGDGMADLATILIQEAQKRQLQDDVNVPIVVKGMTEGIEEEIKILSEEELAAEEARDKAAEAAAAAVTTDPTKHKHNAFPVEERTIQIAIMGKPNVGKSTLLNGFIGEERVITGPTPGLTRDSISVEWTFDERLFKLVDTAGLTRIQTNKHLLTNVAERKQVALYESVGKHYDHSNITLPGIQYVKPEDDPSQLSTQISEYALLSALHSLQYAQVVLLVVEVGQGKFSKIDLQLAQKCLSEGRAVIIVMNKFDVAKFKGIKETKELEEQVKSHTKEYFREFGNIPIVVTSGLHGTGLKRLLHKSIEVHDAWSKRIPTWILNKWLKEVMVTAPTARHGEKAIHIKYITQVKSRPPTFALFCNVHDDLPTYYDRFLRSRLQEEFQLEGIPVRFFVKKSEGNDVKKHLLKQGKHTRRGIGLGENKGKVGPQRDTFRMLKKVKRDFTDERRRRDTRLRRQREPGNKNVF